jgi:HemY protein
LLAIIFVFLGMAANWLSRWPERRSMARNLKRTQDGLQQLTQALISAGQNDYEPAHKALLRAGNLLPHSPLAHLIGVQISNHSGKPQHVREHLQALTGYESTAKLALQQSLRDAAARHDTPETTRLLAEAQRLYPRAGWVLEARIRLSVKQDNFSALIADLTRFSLRPLLPSTARHRLLARLYFMQYQDARALHMDAGFIPAACRLATTRASQNAVPKALSILKTAWKHQPATPLLDVFMEITEALPAKQQWRLAKTFAARANPYAEADDMMARMALRHGQLDEALTHAKGAMERNATKERFTRIAEVVSARDGAEAANLWLKEALRAAHSESWVCSACGTHHAAWHFICSHCETIDTVAWKPSTAPAGEIIPR